MQADLHVTLEEHFCHAAFRPGQEQVIQSLLAGRSALALFPTRAGNSLCYQLPTLLMDGVTLIISPRIVLVKDREEALRARGVPAARLDSSVSLEKSQRVFERLKSGVWRLL